MFSNKLRNSKDFQNAVLEDVTLESVVQSLHQDIMAKNSLDWPTSRVEQILI
jgi:hypothetical protein